MVFLKVMIFFERKFFQFYFDFINLQKLFIQMRLLLIKVYNPKLYKPNALMQQKNVYSKEIFNFVNGIINAGKF